MKKIFYYILMGAFLLGTATSCEDSVKDLSKVTYFAELNLKGDDFVKLSLGETYTEPGYEATENGEDISEKVKVTGSVDSSTPGFYNLVYSVANVDGFSVTKTRQVMVVNPDSFASAYQGESQAGTRHYTGAPILITENEDGILLSSYEIPEGEDKNTFSYDSMKNVDYSELKKSKKFTPALYHENDGIWEGGSTNQFSPVMTFKLWEKFSDSCLEVSEIIEVNGILTMHSVYILQHMAKLD